MKTSDLQGHQLDCWVARAQGWEVSKSDYYKHQWKPSIDWSQGGPIIEREQIDFEDGGTYAVIDRDCDGVWTGSGSSHLLAAMRAYVASKFGDEVPDDQEPA